MLTSAVQQNDWVIHTYAFFFTFFSIMVYHNIEYSSLCYTIGPCCLSVLHVIVCLPIPDSQAIPLLSTSRHHNSILCLWFCSCCREVHLFHILDSTYKWHYMLFVYLLLIYLMWSFLSTFVLLQKAFHSFYGWVVFHCVFLPHLLYPFIFGWTFWLFSCLACCE